MVWVDCVLKKRCYPADCTIFVTSFEADFADFLYGLFLSMITVMQRILKYDASNI